MEPIDSLLRDALGLEPSTLGTRGADAVIAARMRDLRLADPYQYVAVLRSRKDEFQRLVASLMVNETWFYRYPDSFDHLGELAASVVAAAPGTTFRVLSAPCSTGEEPASAAIALLGAGLSLRRFQIDAVDVSRAALDRARAGRYTRRAFRDTTPGELAPWILPTSDGYEVAPAILERITFHESNLLDREADVPPRDRRYHAILCRNLQIYLTMSARRTLLATLRARLEPNGVLYVGHAELGRVARDGFVALPPLSAFACQPAPAALTNDPAPVHSRTLPAPRPTAPRLPPTRRPVAGSAAPRSIEAASDASPYEEARALADRGVPGEALRVIERAIRFGRADADLYHLQALLHAGESDAGRSREALRRALYLDPAHYPSLIQAALMAEGSGDVQRALRLRERARRVHTKGETG